MILAPILIDEILQLVCYNIYNYFFYFQLTNFNCCKSGIWQDRESALKAVTGTAHRKAMTHFRSMYTDHRIDIWKLVITDNAASYKIVKWFE